MEVLFDEEIAESYDLWAETPHGRKAYFLEGELLLKLGDLNKDQSVLEVGCGTGAHLEIFLKEGMNAMGMDISSHMLRVSRQKLGKGVPLLLGDAENLPFREKSFDCVALITTLEFVHDPERSLQEALRICKGKVLLGVLNKYAFLGIARRLKSPLRPSIFDQARFYTIWELKSLVSKAVPKAILDWASVLVLPMSWQHHFPSLERWLSFRKNPFGAFLGMAVFITEA